MVKTGHAMKIPPLRPPAFYGQAVLIAAPLVVLSVFALFSLRQDRSAIEQEARDLARALAPEISDRIRQQVQKDLSEFFAAWRMNQNFSIVLAWPRTARVAAVNRGTGVGKWQEQFKIDLDALPQLEGRLLNGKIQIPVDYSQSPAPPEWAEGLTAEQSQALSAADQALFRDQDPAAGRRALAFLRASGLPESAIASMELNLLILQTRKESISNASQRFMELARKYPAASSGTGTPVADLALIQATRTASRGVDRAALQKELFQRVIQHPSFLTPELIAEADSTAQGSFGKTSVFAVQTLWLMQERARALMRPLLAHPLDPDRPTELWLESEGKPILVQCRPKNNSKNEKEVSRSPGSAFDITMMPERLLEQAFVNAIIDTRSLLPPYLKAAVQVSGRRWPKDTVSHSDPLPTTGRGMATGSMEIVLPAEELRRLDGNLDSESELAYLRPPAGGNPFRLEFAVSLDLVRDDLLFARYRRRLWFSVGFILAAAGAGGFGLFSAWRAFQRQRRLADMTSNFVASVSHELRAPLASVRLMAESLDQDNVAGAEKQRSYFRLIVQECRRLSSLVENVLDFSRIRQGRKTYEFEPIDLHALVRQTTLGMTPNAEERGVDLRMLDTSSAQDLQPCWDGQAVQQALVNLIDNAIKHSPESATVIVSYGVHGSGPEAKIRLVVEDQGRGIPAEQRGRIFEPFYRLGSELHRETRGIGIGLSLVKHITEAHRGKVWVEDAPDRGSRFTIELPLDAGK